jgi:hypothetical protein
MLLSRKKREGQLRRQAKQMDREAVKFVNTPVTPKIPASLSLDLEVTAFF